MDGGEWMLSLRGTPPALPAPEEQSSTAQPQPSTSNQVLIILRYFKYLRGSPSNKRDFLPVSAHY